MIIGRRQFLFTAALAGAAIGSPVWAAGGARKPNVLLILADDMGYSDPGCYGGEIETPNIDALAAGGVRFTQHYSTGRCWPSRACILTGFYAQQVRRDKLPGIKMGKRPEWAPLLPAMLKPLGYQSYHSGKWHIDGAPKAGGFDRSWGSHKGGCDQDRFFASKPWQEGKYSAQVEKGSPYYSTVAIADHAIACMKLHKEEHPDKPFFQYVAFYSPHFPLHAMKRDIERYRGRYGQGWDKTRESRLERMKKLGLVNCELSARQPDVKPEWNLGKEQLDKIYGEGEQGHAVAWESLADEQKDFQAKKMEVHAAMVSRMDAEIGRIVEHLRAIGEYENTLILIASDNGASAEQINRGDKHTRGAALGSAESYVCLGPGWSTCSNTPFRYHKHWNHEGGISSPLVAHWPNGIKSKGALRHDPSHFIDVVPTVLELAGGNAGDRPGLSLLPAFEHDGAVKHDALWWCHANNKALRMGDWKIAADRGGKWELYDLTNDRSEMHDLAGKRPEVLERLSQKWETMADGFRKRLGRQ